MYRYPDLSQCGGMLPSPKAWQARENTAAFSSCHSGGGKPPNTIEQEQSVCTFDKITKGNGIIFLLKYLMFREFFKMQHIILSIG